MNLKNHIKSSVNETCDACNCTAYLYKRITIPGFFTPYTEPIRSDAKILLAFMPIILSIITKDAIIVENPLIQFPNFKDYKNHSIVGLQSVY